MDAVGGVKRSRAVFNSCWGASSTVAAGAAAISLCADTPEQERESLYAAICDRMSAAPRRPYDPGLMTTWFATGVLLVEDLECMTRWVAEGRMYNMLLLFKVQRHGIVGGETRGAVITELHRVAEWSIETITTTKVASAGGRLFQAPCYPAGAIRCAWLHPLQSLLLLLLHTRLLELDSLTDDWHVAEAIEARVKLPLIRAILAAVAILPPPAYKLPAFMTEQSVDMVGVLAPLFFSGCTHMFRAVVELLSPHHSVHVLQSRANAMNNAWGEAFTAAVLAVLPDTVKASAFRCIGGLSTVEDLHWLLGIVLPAMRRTGQLDCINEEVFCPIAKDLRMQQYPMIVWCCKCKAWGAVSLLCAYGADASFLFQEAFDDSTTLGVGAGLIHLIVWQKDVCTKTPLRALQARGASVYMHTADGKEATLVDFALGTKVPYALESEDLMVTIAVMGLVEPRDMPRVHLYIAFIERQRGHGAAKRLTNALSWGLEWRAMQIAEQVASRLEDDTLEPCFHLT